MPKVLSRKDIISIRDLSLTEVNDILKLAKKIKKNLHKKYLIEKVIAHCFFEPSTRTRLSFETATLRLGGQVIGFSDGETTSTKKGENLQDTIKTISCYADLIIIRHPLEGAARLAAEISDKPIINAGDGANQHPTQALADLFTLQEAQGNLEGLSVAFVGDLKYGRAVHSLVQLCGLFNMRLFLVSSSSLSLPEVICDELKHNGIRFSFHTSLDEVISKIDILYMTRLQQERFTQSEHQLFQNQYVLTLDKLRKVKANLNILHPLPRGPEIDKAIDESSHALYFKQVVNAIYVRQAILALLLDES
ncbi:MAG: aspartate carbamoyltransferase [Candidatus Aquirickettsiella sp.]